MLLKQTEMHIYPHRMNNGRHRTFEAVQKFYVPWNVQASHHTGTSRILIHHPNISVILQKGKLRPAERRDLPKVTWGAVFFFPPCLLNSTPSRAGHRTRQWPWDSVQVPEPQFPHLQNAPTSWGLWGPNEIKRVEHLVLCPRQSYFYYFI